MTIQEAIKQLGQISDRISGHYDGLDGNLVEVKFDCPDCNKSFSPTRITIETHAKLSE